MERLRQHRLVINVECQLFKPRVEFPGHLVDQIGIQLLPAKVEAITKYPRPSLLLSFLGMIIL